MKFSTMAIAGILFFWSLSSYADEELAYPDGYRYWTHVKTLTLHEGHALENPFKGIHHIYANKKGIDGIKNGTFQDGSKIVFDLLKNKTVDHASAEGERVLLGVMVKDTSRFPHTGGWGFDAWAGDSRTNRLSNDGGRSCFACHASQKNRDYVFSRWRD